MGRKDAAIILKSHFSYDSLLLLLFHINNVVIKQLSLGHLNTETEMP